MSRQNYLDLDAIQFLIEEGILEEGYERLIFEKDGQEIVLNDLLILFAMRNQVFTYGEN